MMWRSSFIILLAFFTCVSAKEFEVHQNINSMDQLLDKSKLVERALKAFILHRTVMDDATLAKTQPGLGKRYGVAISRPSLSRAWFPTPILSPSSFPVPRALPVRGVLGEQRQHFFDATRYLAAGPEAQLRAGARTVATRAAAESETSPQIEEISAEEFLELTKDAKHAPLLVDWEGTWCRSCKLLKPELAKLKEEFPQLRFVSINANKSPLRTVEDAGVAKLPTVQVWKQGQRVSEVIAIANTVCIISGDDFSMSPDCSEAVGAEDIATVMSKIQKMVRDNTEPDGQPYADPKKDIEVRHGHAVPSVAGPTTLEGQEVQAHNFYPEIEHISAEEFAQQIRKSDANEPVVVDWYAEWCATCKYLKPKLAKMKELFPKLRIVSIDVNTCPLEVVQDAGIEKMPTIQVWRQGTCVSEVISINNVICITAGERTDIVPECSIEEGGTSDSHTAMLAEKVQHMVVGSTQAHERLFVDPREREALEQWEEWQRKGKWQALAEKEAKAYNASRTKFESFATAAQKAAAAVSDAESHLLSMLDQITSSGKTPSSPQRFEIAALIDKLESSGGFADPVENKLIEGEWELLYPSWDAHKPLGRRSDGSTPGIEGFFRALFGEWPARKLGERLASSSTIREAVRNIDSFTVFQNIMLTETNDPRVDLVVKFADEKVLRLLASASIEPKANPKRVDFTFDLAYFQQGMLHREPFSLEGTPSKGWIDTTYLSENVRISRSNERTRFLFRRVNK